MKHIWFEAPSKKDCFDPNVRVRRYVISTTSTWIQLNIKAINEVSAVDRIHHRL